MAVGNRRSDGREAVKIAVCGVLSALSFVLLTVGALIEVLDFSMVIIASFPILFCVVEMGNKYAILTYLTTSLISFLLLPGTRFPAMVYFLFGGIYPIIKPLFDKIRKPFSYIVKFAFAAVDFSLIYLLSAWLFPTMDEETGKIIVIAFALLTVFTFFVYDLLIERVTAMYFFKWRKMLRIKGFK